MSPHQTFPKPRPAALERKDRRTARTSKDEKESEKVKVRSGGQCEVVVDDRTPFGRCVRRAFHVHHMLGGHGVRARGESAKAIRKQHVCPDHHTAIGNHTLRRIGGVTPHWQDPYERVR